MTRCIFFLFKTGIIKMQIFSQLEFYSWCKHVNYSMCENSAVLSIPLFTINIRNVLYFVCINKFVWDGYWVGANHAV